MHFDDNEFINFSFEDANIHEVFDEMGRQLMEIWLDQRRIKERIEELEMRYGMRSNSPEYKQYDLF